MNSNRIKTLLAHLPGYEWLISWSQAANLVKQAGVEALINRGRQSGPDATNGLVVSYDRGASGYATAANKPLTRIYVEQLNAAVKRAGGELMMCYIPISQEVLEYRRTRTISPDERAIQRLAADNGMMLWSLTPLLAHSGQSIERLYYKEGHWTAAAHAMAAHYLSRLIQSGLSRRGLLPGQGCGWVLKGRSSDKVIITLLPEMGVRVATDGTWRRGRRLRVSEPRGCDKTSRRPGQPLLRGVRACHPQAGDAADVQQFSGGAVGITSDPALSCR